MRASSVALAAMGAVLWVAPVVAEAQNNEVGLLAGATFTPSVGVAGSEDLQFNPSLAFGIEYDRRVIGTPLGSLDGGIDFAASPLDVKTSAGPPTAVDQYAYLFLTPHVRLKLRSIAGAAPWVSVGGGFADFTEGKYRNGVRNPNSGTQSGTGEFAGGVDFNTPLHFLLPIALRGEVKDFLSGQPKYNASTSGAQNNVVVSGGFVLRF